MALTHSGHIWCRNYLPTPDIQPNNVSNMIGRCLYYYYPHIKQVVQQQLALTAGLIFDKFSPRIEAI
jgi:hypothetical protein